MSTRSIVGPEGRPAVFFTEHSHQVLSTCAHLLGLSILSCCLSHRAPSLTSWKEWANLTWSRWSVILVLLDSWLFVFFTGVLVNGVGLSSSQDTCALAIYACISFYVLSKVLIYGFLVEKVYIVWSGGRQMRRFSTPAYRICSVVLLGYVTVLVLMILGQNSWIRGDGMCIIGLKNFASLPTIAYDLFLNVFLTGMFLWPIWRSSTMSPRLRNIAIRTLYGACASLITSAANMAILTALHGQEYGWACLGSCVTDVALNAMALSWVTAGSYSRSTPLRSDRFLPTTTSAGPLTLVQSEPGKETDQRGTVTFQSTRDIPSPPPESYYDQTPLDQESKSGSGAGGSKGLFWSLRAALSHAQEPSDAATLVAPPTIHVKQLSSRSEEVMNPISRTLQMNPDSDIMGGGPQPFSNDVALGNEPYSRRHPNSNTEGERDRHGFIDRFRSFFSQKSSENKDDDLELDFAQPDQVMGYTTSPPPRTSSSSKSPNYDSQCNADLPRIYEEFRRPYPPEKHVRVLNRFVTRMPTIESLGSKEVGSTAHSAAHSSSMYTSSSGCYDEEASLKSTRTQTTTHSALTTSDTPYHTGSEPLSRSNGSISHGSFSGMNPVREEEHEGGREFVNVMEAEEWEHADHGDSECDSSTSESHSVTSYSTATNSGSPCQSLSISAGHFGQSSEESAS